MKIMAKTNVTGITRIINAATYSWRGFKAAYKHEAAFRQELWLTIAATPVAIYFGETLFEKGLLIASLLLILLVEMINSAIEAVVDRFGDEHHELSGRAKDMGSAAVLPALFISGIIWISLLA